MSSLAYNNSATVQKTSSRAGLRIMDMEKPVDHVLEAPEQAQACKQVTLRLRTISIRGFKTFAEQTYIADLRSFSCIIGPNGTGKSVIGEAIAFALGASPQMLRVKTLTGVISTCQTRDGLIPQEAAVSLHFVAVNIHTGACVKQVSVRKQISRKGRTQCYIAMSAMDEDSVDRWQKDTDEIEFEVCLNDDACDDTGESSALESEDDIDWGSPVRAADVALVLRNHGLRTEHLDRLVVTQHRRAVDVADPKRLARLVEEMIGSTGLRDEAEEAVKALEDVYTEEKELDRELEALQERGASLSPAVAAWFRYAELKVEAVQRAAELAAQKARAAQTEAEEASEEMESVEKEVVSASNGLESARSEANQLLEEKEGAQERAEAKAGGLVDAQGALQDMEILLQKAKVRTRETENEIAARVAATGAGSLEEAQKFAQRERHRAERCIGRLGGLIQAHEKSLESLAKCMKSSHVENTLQKDETAVGGEADAELYAAAVALKLAKARAEVADLEVAELQAQHREAALRCDALRIHMHRQSEDIEKSNRSLEDAERKLEDCIVQEAECQQVVQRAALEVAAVGLDAHENSLQQAQADADFLATEISHLKLQCGEDSMVNCGEIDVPRQTEDQALATLAQRSLCGTLPGTFYGRLNALLRVSDPIATTAVNSCLQERFNLSNTVVTSNRATARSVVDHFKQHRVGRVSCIVLDELPQHSPTDVHTPAGTLLESVALPNNPPLTSLVVTRSVEDAPGALALREYLLGGWCLVQDASVAVTEMKKSLSQMQKAQECVCSSVSLDGTILKSDGEIVGRNQKNHISPASQCAIKLEFVSMHAPISRGDCDGDSLQSKQAAATTLKELQSKLESVEKHIIELGNDRKTLMDIGKSASAALVACQSTHSRLERARPGLEKAVSRAKKALSKATEGMNSLAEDYAAAENDCAALKKQTASASSTVMSAAEEMLHAEQVYKKIAQGSALGKIVLKEEMIQEERRVQHDQLAEEVLGYQAEMHAEKQKLEEFSLLLDTHLEASEKLDMVRNQLRETDSAVAKARDEAQTAQQHLMDARAEAAKVDKAWRSAISRHQGAAKKHAVALTRYQSLQHKVREARACSEDMWNESLAAKKQADTLSSEVSKIPRAAAGTYAKATSERHTAHGSPSPLVHSESIIPHIRCGSDICSSDVDSDTDCERGAGQSRRGRGRFHSQGQAPPRVCERRKKKQKKRMTMGTGPISNSSEERVWSIEYREACEAEVAQQLLLVATLEAQINTDAMLDGVAVYTRATELQERLQEKEMLAQELVSKVEALNQKRYGLFESAMDLADSQLSSIYQELTAGNGDAHCSFPRDPIAAFEQGVTFKVRPDNSAWRNFSGLSGGQQALAAVALCLALQSAAPSPIFYFDEIDAALDYLNARRLARVLADKSRHVPGKGYGPQFIVVSHKGEMQKEADAIVGVTTAAHGQGSQVETLVRDRIRIGGEVYEFITKI